MKKGLATVALVALAALAFIAWLRFLHDPQVRRDAAQHTADSVALALGQGFKDSLAVYIVQHVRDSLRDDSLARAAAEIRTVALPAAQTAVAAAIAGIPDTAVRRIVQEAVLTERAEHQQAARADSLRIATLLHRVSSLEDLVASGAAAVDSLSKQLAARPRRSGHWGVGVGLGPSVGTKGFDPVTVQLGLRYNF